MKQKPAGRPSSSEKIIRDIKRKTRQQYSAEEKIRIVLDGLRGEVTDLRREARDLEEVVADQTLELRLLKKSMLGDGDDLE
jgi:transposase